MPNYIVATTKSWNAENFETYTRTFEGSWHLIDSPDALTIEYIESIDPRYIFFPHWSWIVPEHIFQNYECVCFHMTDVPYGRGGSPLQNLIARGHKETKLTALKMTKQIDAGPVYKKVPLSLAGSAEDILKRASKLSYDIMADMIQSFPIPVNQTGDITEFSRRTPDMSELPLNASLEQLYDHIRMLDAEGYPHAFLKHGDNLISFTNATLENGELKCSVTVRKEDKK